MAEGATGWEPSALPAMELPAVMRPSSMAELLARRAVEPVLRDAGPAAARVWQEGLREGRQSAPRFIVERRTPRRTQALRAEAGERSGGLDLIEELRGRGERLECAERGVLDKLVGRGRFSGLRPVARGKKEVAWAEVAWWLELGLAGWTS